jgi:hypothetical protein
MTPKLLSVMRIWDNAPHNALTDLIYFRDAFFCCFREADQHAGSEDGKIRILTSTDAVNWKPVALLSKKGIDLRDPMLSIMPNGRLLLNMGGSHYLFGQYLGCSPHAAISEDGTHWSEPVDLQWPNEWIWRVTWHDGTGYGAAYRLTDPFDFKKPWLLSLFKTIDGLSYEKISQIDVPGWPSEATLRFTKDGTMVALLRRNNKGWIGSSRPPYTSWNWFRTMYRLGGPNFLILPDGSMWACSRLHKRKQGERYLQTALVRMGLHSYKPVLIFPSGGDTSYAGMVYRDQKLYISYYSSHEENPDHAKIYLAIVSLK